MVISYAVWFLIWSASWVGLITASTVIIAQLILWATSQPPVHWAWQLSTIHILRCLHT